MNEEGPMTTLRHATLLARVLTEALLMNVQRTAEVNLAAADALLTQARLPRPMRFDQCNQHWVAAWRSFEVCAQTADQLLGLTCVHAQRSTEGLWSLANRLLTELAGLPAAQLQSLREAFEDLRQAQEQHLQAASHAHGRLLAVVGEVPHV
jgi:hypothetical protein